MGPFINDVTYECPVLFRNRVKDKSDRATIEQVMDPRTRMILFKLLNRGFISEINGCISTGNFEEASAI